MPIADKLLTGRILCSLLRIRILLCTLNSSLTQSDMLADTGPL